MTRNLNYAAPSSWCYGDEPATCAAEDRLYSWQAARRACPSGWRLPTDADWLALISPFGGHYVLKEKRTIGDPTKSYAALLEGGTSGFNARLSGGRDTLARGRSADRGEDGMYWSESNRGQDSVSLFVFNRKYGRLLRDEWKADFAASVRCVQGP